MERRTFLKGITSCIPLICISPVISISNLRFNNEDLETALRLFIKYPYDDNAIVVGGLMHNFDSYSNEKQNRILELIDFNIYHIEFGILKGRPIILDLAFKLRKIADGGLSESLAWITGPFIHINPEKYLVVLKANFNNDGFSRVLCNLGDSYVDKLKLQNFELDKRIQSLSKVNKRSLIPLRDTCINILNDSKFSEETINYFDSIDNEEV